MVLWLIFKLEEYNFQLGVLVIGSLNPLSLARGITVNINNTDNIGSLNPLSLARGITVNIN